MVARWDAAQGIWVGGRAAGSAPPSPLWIFGYGSLCWKSDFPAAENFVGNVYGWRRFFAQKSMDHRGTPSSPGLVATLVRDADLVSLGLSAALAEPTSAEEGASHVCGVCYRVDDADAVAVLDSLDFREKGGYTRELVDVFPFKGDGPPVKALLYTGTPDNPNFTPRPISDVEFAAATIAKAVGPSGPNAEYLFELETFLNSVGEHCGYIERLCALTRQYMQSEKA